VSVLSRQDWASFRHWPNLSFRPTSRRSAGHRAGPYGMGSSKNCLPYFEPYLPTRTWSRGPAWYVSSSRPAPATADQNDPRSIGLVEHQIAAPFASMGMRLRASNSLPLLAAFQHGHVVTQELYEAFRSCKLKWASSSSVLANSVARTEQARICQGEYPGFVSRVYRQNYARAQGRIPSCRAHATASVRLATSSLR
jgi:hypothetical protein